MSDGQRIASAAIVASVSSYGQAMVTATLEDGGMEVLFRYYVDELTFTAEEFAGLTVEQARELHHERDVAYLRS